MIIQASPVEMRKCLEMAQMLKQIGLLFVPMPVASEEEYQARLAEFGSRMEQIATELEKEELE